MNQFFKSAAFLAISLVLFSCAESGKKGDENKSGDSGKKETNTGAQMEKQAAPVAVNVIKAMASNGDLNTWGVLLGASKWGKEAIVTPMTVLCPKESCFKQGKELLSGLKHPTNQALLDDIMAMHLLKEPLSPEKLLLLKEVETVSGKMLTIDAAKRTIGGIGFAQSEIITGVGTIIVLDDMLYYPEAELKASGKALNKMKK